MECDRLKTIAANVHTLAQARQANKILREEGITNCTILKGFYIKYDEGVEHVKVNDQ
jgi:hypothetical protein